MRVKVTALAGSAAAFRDTKTPPVEGAAQSVELSPRARSPPTTFPPALSPNEDPVRDGAPSFSQSPHVNVDTKSPVHSLQCFCISAIVWVPKPCVLVRQTWPVPTNI